MTARRASLVVDLGFGDAGKGAVTDFLGRSRGASLVVRFNGGAQAGHNVVTPDGVHHTFAQFGAATFSGARTLLSRFVVLHPTALAVEARYLAEKGIVAPLDRVLVDERALVTTPFHQASCRIRELARGDARHGSCGVGVGETVADALASPADALRAGDLRDELTLRRKLVGHRDAKRAELAGLAPDAEEWSAWANDAVVDRFIAAARSVASRVVDRAAVEAALASSTEVVFEGAQGVLLDEDHGFHPPQTWSRCTFTNALAILDEARWDGAVERIGVHRAYSVRHGAGPFPTEDRSLACDEPHNVHGPWQGGVRFGHLDAVLLRYALGACGGVDSIALTHVDQLRPEHRISTSYDGSTRSLPSVAPGDLEHAARLGRALREVRPDLVPFSDDPIADVERHTDHPVGIVGSGPRAGDYLVRRGSLRA